jgi:formamidopyrimidine-DNA glycosylase
MPELPEVETVVNELNKKLKNRVIQSVVVNWPKMVGVGPETMSNRREVKSYQVSKFIKLLCGTKVLKVRRRSKLLIFKFSDELVMLVHLKMTGQFIFEDKILKKKTNSHYRLLNKQSAPLVKLPGKHTHVVFNFVDGSTLYFNDIRKFGYLKLVTSQEFLELKEIKEYGPEPLEKNFTLSLFLNLVENIKSRKTSIKQMVMDNSFVVGIGNIYSDEILFQAGVRPDRQVKSIKKTEWENIFKWIKPILQKGIDAKGSSVGDFVRTDGSWGQMGKFHFVYGRKGKECKKCGTIIKSIKLGGRTACFCPKCQK